MSTKPANQLVETSFTILREYPELMIPSYRAGQLPRLIERFDLSSDDVDLVAYTCTNYRTDCAQVGKYLAKGYTPEAICAAYRAQRESQGMGVMATRHASIRYVLLLQETFPELYDADDLSYRVVDLVEEVLQAVPSIHYPDRAIKLLCQMANRHDLCSVEAALDALRRPVCDPDYVDRDHDDDAGEPEHFESIYWSD